MSVHKQFLPNVLLVIGLNLLIKPFYIFGIDRSVQNVVGAEDYGIYFALLNFVYLFEVFNDLGVQNFHHSVYSKFDFLIAKYLPKILGSKILLSIFFVLISLLGAISLGYDEEYYVLIGVLAFNQILASFLLFMRTALSARGHYQLDSFLSVLDKLVMIFLVGYLLWFAPQFELHIRHFVGCQTVSFAVAVLAAGAFLSRHHIMDGFKIRFDWSYTKWLLRKSLPYALVLLLMLLYTRMDGVMIERMLDDGKEQAGIYAASYRILNAFNMVGLLFAGLLLPMFSKMIAAGRSTDVLVRGAGSMLWCISVTMVVICLFWAEPIMIGLYESADEYWSEVFRMLIGSFIAVSMAYVYGTLLTAGERIHQMNRIFALGALLNFALNLILIRQWKALGAATATLITQSLTTLALLWLAHRELRLSLHVKGLFRSLIFLLVMLVGAFFIWRLPFGWEWQICMTFLTALGGTILTRQWPSIHLFTASEEELSD